MSKTMVRRKMSPGSVIEEERIAMIQVSRFEKLFPAADNNTEIATVAYKGVVFDELLVSGLEKKEVIGAC